MTDAWGTNPTQVTGLVAFAVAAVACMRAAHWRARPWWGLMAAQWGCFAEILFTMRFRIHDAVDATLQARHLYAQRTLWQIALLMLAVALAAACLWAAWRWRRRDPEAAWAFVGTIVAVTLFVTESVSLHAVDTVMYTPMGPIVAIAAGWAAAAAIVTVSALRAARH